MCNQDLSNLLSEMLKRQYDKSKRPYKNKDKEG